MNSKNIFRTEVDTSLSINNLSHSDRFILIDGDQSIDKVFEDIWSAVQEKFEL